jgi:transcription-repair coupling factor (superfamily II helicase)
MKIQKLPLAVYEEPTFHGYKIFKRIRDAVDALQTEAQKYTVIIGSTSPRRLVAALHEQGISTTQAAIFPKDRQHGITILPLPVRRGYRFDDVVVFAEEEILGPVYAQQQAKTKLFRQDFDVGDYVVHKKHGIGQFLGLEKITVNDHIHECLKLLYAAQQKLYVPIESFDDLSRYGDSDMSVVLDELGSLQFQRRKAKAKARINEMCHELLQVAAKRKLIKAPVTEYDSVAMDRFAAGFKHVETRDQVLAIQDVLSDLASGMIMDRIVCGDAGFGKTEVALRAICATVVAGYQVAILTPTTTLCLQHYRILLERFDNLVVKQLSRLISPAEQKQIKEQTAEGQVSIVVGTTALLSDALQFKNLGLVVIDEEHHFGVKQKEKIKKQYPHVHMLALSATPIPRTLQLSLAGVKELSLLGSPPLNRKPITTFSGVFDPIQIGEAVQNEMQQNGQIFWIVPRIKEMADAYTMIRKLLPKARICKVHGKMEPEEVTNFLIHFSEKKYDVMLATSIIEAGVDLPSANTMVIQNAHLFGLAQLYQLRGRVGRSDTKAYAFLTYPEETVLTSNAVKRLSVLQQLDKLGIGFTLATQDMDIRGYGNLIGSEQSGHIKEIGIELYQDLLESTMEHMKTHNVAPLHDDDVEIQLNIPVYIPEDYVEAMHMRLDLYNRIASLKTREELKQMRIELEDRFGALPTPVLNLLEIIAIKQMCRLYVIAKISAGSTGVAIIFHQFPKHLIPAFSENKDILIRNDGSIVIKCLPAQHLSKLQGVLQIFSAVHSN